MTAFKQIFCKARLGAKEFTFTLQCGAQLLYFTVRGKKIWVCVCTRVHVRVHVIGKYPFLCVPVFVTNLNAECLFESNPNNCAKTKIERASRLSFPCWSKNETFMPYKESFLNSERYAFVCLNMCVWCWVGQIWETHCHPRCNKTPVKGPEVVDFAVYFKI